jgi:hypothetical protein
VPRYAKADTAPNELGRVDLVVPVRPESVAWLDEIAERFAWTREKAARHALAAGRRAVALRLDHKPTGPRVTAAVLAPAPSAGLESWQDDEALSGGARSDSSDGPVPG